MNLFGKKKTTKKATKKPAKKAASKKPARKTKKRTTKKAAPAVAAAPTKKRKKPSSKKRPASKAPRKYKPVNAVYAIKARKVKHGKGTMLAVPMGGKVNVKSVIEFVKPVAIGVGGVLGGNFLINQLIKYIPSNATTVKYRNEIALAAKLGLAVALPRLIKHKAARPAAFGLAVVALYDYTTTKFAVQLANLIAPPAVAVPAATSTTTTSTGLNGPVFLRGAVKLRGSENSDSGLSATELGM